MSQPLNQIIALVSGRKKEAEKAITDLHQKTQKAALFGGVARTYAPRDAEDIEVLPPESQEIQLRTKEVLGLLDKVMSNIYDLILTQDAGNTQASSDIVVDGNVLVENVPVTTLLYLEKQLEDLNKFYATLPVLDPAKQWNWVAGDNCFKNVSKKHRTRRTKRPLVLYNATKEHPAQVQLVEEDAIVGDWTTVEMSGAVEASTKTKLLERVRKLKDAVVVAREKANQTPVIPKSIGKQLFSYLHDALN